MAGPVPSLEEPGRAAHPGFGAALRRYREVRGWSQGQLARRIGVTQATVSLWEAGRAAPRLEHLIHLVQFLPPLVSYIPEEQRSGIARLLGLLRGLGAGDKGETCGCRGCTCA